VLAKQKKWMVMNQDKGNRVETFSPIIRRSFIKWSWFWLILSLIWKICMVS